MSMFQILTQKGWNEVMHSTMFKAGEKVAPLIAIYFIFYHLFVTLVSCSIQCCFDEYIIGAHISKHLGEWG